MKYALYIWLTASFPVYQGTYDSLTECQQAATDYFQNAAPTYNQPKYECRKVSA